MLLRWIYGVLFATLMLLLAGVSTACAAGESMAVFEQSNTLRIGNPASISDTSALTPTDYWQPDLSPDGTKVVAINQQYWGSGGGASKLYIIPTAGGAPTTIWTATTSGTDASLKGTVNYPRFSPDGQWIIYSFKPTSGTTGSAIWKMRVNGTSRQKVVDWAGDQTWPAYNPAGTQLTFMSTHQTNGTIFPTQANERATERFGKIFTSTAAGGNPKQLATPADQYQTAAPTFSPDGTQIAYHARVGNPSDPYNHVWVARLSNPAAATKVSFNLTGMGDSRACVDGASSGGMFPSWAPDGKSLIFQSSNSAPCMQVLRTLTNGSYPWVVYTHPASNSNYRTWVRYRPPSGPSDYLAQKFRPLFYFDTDEHWRPLEVHRFLAENQDHKVCTASGCTRLSSPSGLSGYPTSSSWIDISGVDDQEGTFKSPDPDCNFDPLRDCNGGWRTAAYYDSKVSPDGYRYFNYWWFYRFNDAADAGSVFDPNLDHEGDWENMSVAIPWSGTYNPDPPTFDFVVYGQHGHMFNYLKQNVACDGSPHNDVAGGGKPCTSNGLRPHAFVAEGTHATYPDQCGAGVCGQNESPGSPPAPEQQHDGARAWDRNGDGDAFIGFPRADASGTTWGSAASGKSWVDWPGNWGGSGESGHASPESPALQPQFKAPWSQLDCADGNDPCAAGVGSPRRAGSANASCRRWFGPSVAVALCSPSQLRIAVRRKTLRSRGSMRIRRVGGRGHTRAASAPGLAQLSGSPLQVGQSVVVRGRVPQDARLYLRAGRGKRLVEARFARESLGSGRTRITVARIRNARASARGGDIAITAISGSRRSAPAAVRIVR